MKPFKEQVDGNGSKKYPKTVKQAIDEKEEELTKFGLDVEEVNIIEAIDNINRLKVDEHVPFKNSTPLETPTPRSTLSSNIVSKQTASRSFLNVK